MNQITVKSLHIYPIKALAGIELPDSRVLTEGLENDRRFMLVDEDGKFISQRDHNKLALFKCQIEANILNVSFESDAIQIDLNQTSGEFRNVSVWDSQLKAELSEKIINDWFSDKLSQKVSLVRLNEANKRSKVFYKPPFRTYVSFADGYPILLLSEESMALLNSKLDEKILIDRFRANIILSNCEAHEEDAFEDYRIGSTVIRNIKPCARCIVPTVNQQTGNKSKEPLKTLATYRKSSNNIFFGVNGICLQEGSISKGDILEHV